MKQTRIVYFYTDKTEITPKGGSTVYAMSSILSLIVMKLSNLFKLNTHISSHYIYT